MSAPRPAGGDCDFDVAIVGYGPVGQALSALLGRAGHTVAVFERFQDFYRLPRAVHLDHEVMRILQSLDLADVLTEQMVPLHDYHWFGADGELIVRFESPNPSPSGWEPDYMFFQPDLERAIDAHAVVPSGVFVQRGWTAEEIAQVGDRVQLTVRPATETDGGRHVPSGHVPSGEARTITARWLIGADGANSFVREASGITRRDLGFRERWVVVDAEPHDMAALAHLPIASQLCDPRRPTTVVQSGLRHRRWEFMLLPGEEPSDFEDQARIWPLLEPWFRPEDGQLVRSAVYEFGSMLADEMRRGRVLLAGDAAHLTPPFLGQGLCSGLRDAINIAWKLDLVLWGLAPEQLLDTIAPERQPQNEAIIQVAIELGKVLCQLDPVVAAERDAMLRQVDAAPPPPPLAPLSDGVIHRTSGAGQDPLAGTLSVQGTVAVDGRTGLFDDVAGRGFQLIVKAGDPLAHLSAAQRALVDELGIVTASLEAGTTGMTDVDGRLSAWLAEHDRHGVLVRPDFYVFGSVAEAEDIPALLDDLRSQLQITPTTAVAGATP